MNGHEVTSLVISLLGLALAGSIYSRSRREVFRSDVRRIRDELFDFMWQNGHSFGDSGYRATRDMLNGVLRLSNTFSFWQLMWMIYLHFRWRPANGGKCSNCRSAVPAIDTRLEQTKHDVAARMVQFALREGATGLVVSALLALLAVCRRAAKTKEWTAKQSRILLHDAALLSRSDDHRWCAHH